MGSEIEVDEGNLSEYLKGKRGRDAAGKVHVTIIPNTLQTRDLYQPHSLFQRRISRWESNGGSHIVGQPIGATLWRPYAL